MRMQRGVGYGSRVFIWSSLLTAAFIVPLWSNIATGQGFETLTGLLPAPAEFSEKATEGSLRSATLEQLENLSRNKTLNAAVVSPSCTAHPTLTDFFEIRPNAKPALSPPVSLDILRLRDPKLTDLWNILRSIRTGAAILRKFEPKYGYEFRVVFETMPSKGKAPSNAAALYRPTDKTIAIQPGREAGEIAFVLLHEMVHALDGDYRRALERERELRARFEEHLQKSLQNTPRKQAYPLSALADEYELLRQFRDMRVFRAERFAYDASFEAWKELSSLYPQYYKGRGLAGTPVHYSDTWLVKILKIRPAYVEKYIKGECRTVQNLDDSPPSR